MREVWPGSPLAEATFGELLSHQCGLAALDRRASLWDHAEVVEAIEAQRPAWRPGEGHGYHPRTFGALLEEPLRRLTGGTLGQEWWEKIAAPLGLDFWIGLPEKEALAKAMQRSCGTGGTVKEGRIEIQGDQREAVARILTEAGFRPVMAGG